MSLNTLRPFTRAEALRAGIDPASARFKRLLPGVHIAVEVGGHTDRPRRSGARALPPDGVREPRDGGPRARCSARRSRKSTSAYCVARTDDDPAESWLT